MLFSRRRLIPKASLCSLTLQAAQDSAQQQGVQRLFLIAFEGSCGVRGLFKTFDCVLVVGGYNDVNRRKRVAEDVLCTGVKDMFQACLYLLSATPCDAPAESCVVAGASEAASQASLGISGSQTSESACVDVSLEMPIETFVAGRERKASHFSCLRQRRRRSVLLVVFLWSVRNSVPGRMRCEGMVFFALNPQSSRSWMTRIVFLGRT